MLKDLLGAFLDGMTEMEDLGFDISFNPNQDCPDCGSKMKFHKMSGASDAYWNCPKCGSAYTYEDYEDGYLDDDF